MHTWHTQMHIHRNGKKNKRITISEVLHYFPCYLYYGPAILLLSNYLKEISMNAALKDVDNNVYMKPQAGNSPYLSADKHRMEYYRSADGYSDGNSRMRSIYSAPTRGCESQGNLPVVTTRRTGSGQEETQHSVVSRTELHLMGDHMV